MFRRKKKPQPDLAALRRVPALQGHGESTLQTVAELGRLTDHDEGTALVEEGSLSTQIFLILEGSVEVTSEGEVVATLDDGDVFGEAALLDWWKPPRDAEDEFASGRRTATVTATSVVQTLCFEPREFEDLRERAPAAARSILDQMKQRFRTESDDQ